MAERKPIVAGNWKMNLTTGEAVSLVSYIKNAVAEVADVEIVVCPTATALSAVNAQISGTNVALGAQNVHWEDKGAFTGELSPAMLKDVGCTYAIIGHSERRQYFGETDETVNMRLKNALSHGLMPIMCLGERLEQREAGETFTVVERQLRQGLADVTVESPTDLVIAYEPVWAIGTGKTATAEQAEEVHAFLREKLATIWNQELADGIRIQYGGSVKPANCHELLTQPNVDGGLIGGASLDSASFVKIVKFKEQKP